MCLMHVVGANFVHRVLSPLTNWLFLLLLQSTLFPHPYPHPYPTSPSLRFIAGGVGVSKCSKLNALKLTHLFPPLYPSQLVFTSCVDGNVRVWDARTGMCEKVLTGHTDMILDLQLVDLRSQEEQQAAARAGATAVRKRHAFLF